MTDLEIFKDTITSHGYRLTSARTETFKLLLNSEPQTMQEIIGRSKGRIDRVSIYRCIELFEKLGIVHRVNFGWKYKLELSDKFFAHHHHLICLDCGKVIDIKDEKHIDEFVEKVASSAGFNPVRHIFEIEGKCSDCTSP